jgi:hypothetical protein
MPDFREAGADMVIGDEEQVSLALGQVTRLSLEERQSASQP